VRNDVAMTALTATKLPQLIPAGTSHVQVELVHMPTRELSQVNLGRTFAFGLLEDNLSWCLIRLSSIRSLVFLEKPSGCETQVRWSRKTAGELLSNLELPASGKLQFRDQPGLNEQVVVLGVSRGFIAIDGYQQQHIPLTAISYLEITGSE
jgi:hypothetical protein